MAGALRIAVDAMGGDYGPSVTVPAALRSLAQHAELEIVLVGQEAAVRDVLGGAPPSRLRVCHAEQVVTMAEAPSRSLRKKRHSSLGVAIALLQRGEVSACVSAGNTGAMMALGRSLLAASPGVDRPAICALIPTVRGHCYLLDVGANVDSSAAQLLQFALMGAQLARQLDGNSAPRVALLNIAAEKNKGSEQVKLVDALMRDEHRLNYIGHAEADGIFDGHADVVVCDGFVGNVALKSAEGAAKLVAVKGRQLIEQRWLARAAFWLARPAIGKLRTELDPEAYNGAFFLGLQGVLVKSHGGASAHGFHQAIDRAIGAVENRMVRDPGDSPALASG